MRVLGINAIFHDPAAAVVVDGESVAAAEEERFSRRKPGKPPKFRAPQLATLVDAVPAGNRWMHEIKFDGYRAMAACAESRLVMPSAPPCPPPAAWVVAAARVRMVASKSFAPSLACVAV